MTSSLIIVIDALWPVYIAFEAVAGFMAGYLITSGLLGILQLSKDVCRQAARAGKSSFLFFQFSQFDAVKG